jgi:MFS family permease
MLGFVSLFMDISSELVRSLVPLLLVDVLHAQMLQVGIIEGIVEATALLIRIFSGALSDFIGKRKILLLFGYGLATLSIPIFSLAQSIKAVFIARLSERIGKGIRDAPRDALIADVSSKENLGSSYGLRQSMDSIGAVLGPLGAVLLLFLWEDIRFALWFALIPAAISMLIIFFKIQEPQHLVQNSAPSQKFSLSSLKDFPNSFWLVTSIGSIFMFSRFSEAFLILKAQEAGFKLDLLPLVIALMSIAYVFSAYPAGKLSDRLKRKNVLIIGILLLICADLMLAQANSYWMIFTGVAFWGLHMGFSQGVLSAMVADTAPQDRRGTAFGIFNLVSGVTVLSSSILAGWIWQSFGSSYTFYAGVLFATISLGLLIRKNTH